MELQFHKKSCDFVSELVSQCKEQELTDEIRLPDNLADVGRVLGAWGQVLIRGKEWRPDRVSVSGGVMVWVLYIPENSNQPQMVEGWLPFYEQWPVAETQQDGSIVAMGHLTFCDARSVSARKLMLRAGLCLDVQVYAPCSESVYTPDQTPDNIQVQMLTHQIMLPAEAGEKNFSLEEQISVPSNFPKLQKILRYHMLPQILETKVSGGRVIFRGVCAIHVLGMDEDGQLHSFDTEVPFSQYTQLDREYEDGADAIVRPVVTNLELDVADNQMLSMKCGLSGQYVIRENREVEVAQDAYSTDHEIVCSRENMKLPTVMQEQTALVAVRRPTSCDGVRIADAVFVPGMPELRSAESGLLLSGRFYVLYYDKEGDLQSMTLKWEQEEQPEYDQNLQLRCRVMPYGKTSATLGEAIGQLQLEYFSTSAQGLEMISGITIGNEIDTDHDRPAIVVRKAGGDCLWTIAKQSGSTVDAIRSMNELSAEPEPERILLIPIM